MLNSRSFDGAKLRKVAVSTDGGQTWSALRDDPQLPEPMCMGSILRLSDPLDGEPSRILYSGPGTQSGRTQGTIRMSTDEGKTWPISRLIEPEDFAYSVLTKLPDGRIGCLYETDSYERIVFARFSVAWLETPVGGLDQ
ncbi:MAG: exo-alpha-sialidase, partial [bacterium]|nr:exo-alpha-sialidase [bacterium]